MKQIKPQDIPTYHIDTQAPLGIELSYLDMENESDRLTIHSQRNRVHRDDYYMFLFMETVDIRLIVDFEEIELTGTANVVMYTRPGQVHFATSIRETKGWFLMINAMLVEKNYKNIFERQFLTQRPILLDRSATIKMQATAHLLHSIIQATPTAFSHGIICNLANVFIGIIAEQYAGSQETL